AARKRDSSLRPVTWSAVRFLDDLAYGAGVWRGCAKQRTVRPLLPHLWWTSRDGLGSDKG
ncbi:hypothetical protein ACFQ07_21615, partial [Actinomadura adrarensis]